MRLKDIASINTGLTLKEKPAADEAGDCLLLQLGDIDANGNVIGGTTTPYQGAYERFVLTSGDLIFRGRGAAIAVAAVGESARKLVAAAPLIIIRPDARLVDSSYLRWFLTSPPAHKYFSQHMRGSIIMGIGKKDLENLPVPLPDMQTQKKVGALARLQKEEKYLAEKYLKMRQDLFNRQMEETLRYIPTKKAGTR